MLIQIILQLIFLNPVISLCVGFLRERFAQ